MRRSWPLHFRQERREEQREQLWIWFSPVEKKLCKSSSGGIAAPRVRKSRSRCLCKLGKPHQSAAPSATAIPQLQDPLQRLSQLRPASSNFFLGIQAALSSSPSRGSAHLSSVLASGISYAWRASPAKPFSAADGPSAQNLSRPALPCNRAAVGQSMRGLGNKDRLDHHAARAAARETFQDETRLEQRFRVAPCGEKALLEARAAVIGCVRFCTPPALVLLYIFRPNHGCVRPSSPPHAIMRDARTGERVGCYIQYSTYTAWDATSLSLIP